MSAQTSRARVRACLAALAGATLLTACETDRAIVTEPFGPVIYGSRLVADGRNLPNGTVVLNADGDSAYIEIAGVESLATGAYHVWLATATDGELSGAVLAVGNLEIVQYDTTFSPEGDPIEDVSSTVRNGVFSFSNGGPARRLVLAVPLTTVGTRNVAFVTIETTTDAAAPTLTGPRPLWTDLDMELLEDGEELPLSFGTFDPDPELRYVYVPVGRGFGNFIGENVLTVADSALARPPVGYFYASSLIGRDDRQRAVDTLSLGDLTAPFPRRAVSLREADVNATIDPVVQTVPTQQILAGGHRFEGSARPFTGFSEIVLHLETKQGIALASPTFVLSGPVPTIVSAPPATED